MKSPRRFERKILLAIAAVGAVAVLGGVGLAGVAVEEAYRVGVNREVGDQLERGLDATRRYFIEVREHAAGTARHLADHHALRRALAEGDVAGVEAVLDSFLAEESALASVRVVAGDMRVERGTAPTSAAIEREAPIGELGSLRVAFRAPDIAVADYQRSGQVVDVYGRLLRNTHIVSRAYVLLYLACLSIVVLIAVGIAVLASRRVTRRMALIAAAARRVGRGDLDVVVPVDASDEISDLTRAFNEMVSDMKGSRARIDYLSRIGAWQEFARRLAHEIKNPLTPIQLAVQEVHRRYEGEDAAYRRALDDTKHIVEEEVATLRRLVSEFSSFAKLPEAHLEPADLQEFAADAVRGLQHSGLFDEGITLAIEAAPSPLPVDLDAMMLKRCVDNLVANAVAAMRNAGKTGCVRVLVRKEQAFAVLAVSDEGPGVSHEHRTRVFEPYFTTKSDGTGLGLAIVKKIVLEHEGEITVDTAAGGGAIFEIRLPLRKREVA